MTVLFRDAPGVQRRDWTSAPWMNGTTVPTPLQASGGSTYRYSTVDAFKIAAVTACVGLRAGAFAQLPLKAYDDTTPARVSSPQPELLRRPSSFVVPAVWKIQMSISRDIWGYAVGKITAVDGAGYPSKVEWMMPDHASAHLDYVGGPLRWKFNNEPIDASLVFHIPSRFVTPGNPLGMSPLEKSGLVELAKRAQDFGRDWFVNGAVPSSIIYSDQELNSEQADGIVQTILSKWRMRRPAVLGAGLKHEAISTPANESQFLETMRQAASDIAISFNLPPAKINATLGSGSQIQYANLEQNTAMYLMDSINPDLVVVQESHEQHMDPATYARWSTGAFLRSDLKTRYESYKIAIEADFMTKDEVRALEDMPPMPPRTGGFIDAKGLADAIQRISTGIGTVISTDEARTILNRDGADLLGSLPASEDFHAIAEIIQKIYLGVGVLITPEEAREIVNGAGGNLNLALPLGGAA